MGASKSKNLMLSEIKAVEKIPRSKLDRQEYECQGFTLRPEEQKQEYQARYLELELKYADLQNSFLELKSKLEVEELSSGDFSNRADELDQKLSAILNERDCIKSEYPKRLDSLVSNQNSVENGIRVGLRNKVNPVEALYCEKIQRLEMEQQAVFVEKIGRDAEMDQLRIKNQDFSAKVAADELELVEEYSRKGILLGGRCDGEKAELNQQLRQKLNGIMQNYADEVSKCRTTILQDNRILQEKLNTALSDIDALSRKYKLLNNLFEKIRTRYDRRESRIEDLERIADLEGKLIVQSEEMERLKDILNSLKFTTESKVSVNRRNHKNTWKQQKKRNNEQHENLKFSVN